MSLRAASNPPAFVDDGDWKKKKEEEKEGEVEEEEDGDEEENFAHPLILEQRKQTRELNVVNPRSNDLFVVSVRIPMN